MNFIYKILFINIILLSFSINANGQNLVPNGSFEEYSQCPHSPLDPMPDNMIDLATGWSNPTGWSPDYFNSCVPSTTNYGVPTNMWGFQNARTGNAYAGLVSAAIGADSREYIQTELTAPLIAGKQYLVTFYVSLAEVSNVASNNIGAYFSNTPVSVANSLVLPYTPQISNNPFLNPLTDKGGWTEVSGTFTALGGEKYMTIGNFKEDLFTDTVHTNGVQNRSYHYIDDVSVVCLDCNVGISETIIDNKINVFPNPATNFLNIKFNDSYPEKITIFNSIGAVLIVQEQVAGNMQIDIAQYHSGVYFLRIETKENSITKRFLITR